MTERDDDEEARYAAAGLRVAAWLLERSRPLPTEESEDEDEPKGETTVKGTIMAFLIFAMMATATPALADGPVIPQSQCYLEWDAALTEGNPPTGPLKDLKEYRLYVGPSVAEIATVPAFIVASPSPTPTAGRVRTSCATLAPGQYYAQITAVDLVGNESPRSAPIPFEQRDDVAPTAVAGLLVGP